MTSGNGTKRDAKGRLLPGGANLNPGGRPKGLAKTVREMVPEGELVQRFYDIWTGKLKGFSGREQIEAGKWLTDRGYGRVVETQVQIQAQVGDESLPALMASEAAAQLLSVFEAPDDYEVIDVTPSVEALPDGYALGMAESEDEQPLDTTED